MSEQTDEAVARIMALVDALVTTRLDALAFPDDDDIAREVNDRHAALEAAVRALVAAVVLMLGGDWTVIRAAIGIDPRFWSLDEVAALERFDALFAEARAGQS